MGSNLNMLLYVLLFLIILGLFLGSLVRSRTRTGARGDNPAPQPDGGSDHPAEERGDKGE